MGGHRGTRYPATGQGWYLQASPMRHCAVPTLPGHGDCLKRKNLLHPSHLNRNHSAVTDGFQRRTILGATWTFPWPSSPLLDANDVPVNKQGSQYPPSLDGWRSKNHLSNASSPPQPSINLLEPVWRRSHPRPHHTTPSIHPIAAQRMMQRAN